MIADTIEITAEIVRETAAAILIFDGDREVWLPKSMVVEWHELEKGIVELTLPEWLAFEKGLI